MKARWEKTADDEIVSNTELKPYWIGWLIAAFLASGTAAFVKYLLA